MTPADLPLRMTGDAELLGPTTARRFAEAFGTRAVVDRATAARLIGVDPKTLDAMSSDQIIRSVPKGAHRGYTERDLRAYLIEGPAVECAPKPPKPRPAPQPNLKVVNFSERRGRRAR